MAIIVKTGLYSVTAQDVLDNVIGQMSDGMWENSKTMEHYWPFVNIKKINEEVCIVIDTEVNNDKWHPNSSWNNWFLRGDKLGRDREKIRSFFAKKIAQIVREDLKDHNSDRGKFTSKNLTELYYMHSYTKDEDGNYPPITVADAYAVYAALK